MRYHMVQDELKVISSSGNIYEDLGFKDAKQRLAKAELASKIIDVIEEMGISQVEAGKMLGINQPKISALFHGRLEGFSLERLLTFLTSLDQDIKIIIKQKPKTRREHGKLKIAFA